MAIPSKLPLTSPASVPVDRHSPAAAAEAVPAGEAASVVEPAPIWLQRLSLGVLVVFCLYLGGILMYLPWWKQMWDDNSFLLDLPALHHLILLGWVRGLVSGIGLLDLWIGISEIIHYREYHG